MPSHAVSPLARFYGKSNQQCGDQPSHHLPTSMKTSPDTTPAKMERRPVFIGFQVNSPFL
jgi:hypothetical protein